MSTRFPEQKGRPGPRRILIIAGILTVIVCFIIAGSRIGFRLRGPRLPQWIPWTEKSIQPAAGSDISGTPDAPDPETLDPETIQLANRRLTVQKDGLTVWQSPEDILVQDFLWCDINHDSENELILLCWRIGRYGQARPYWVKEDENDWSQHIYIYGWEDQAIHPLWMASDIGMDVLSFAFDETDRLLITETSGRKTAWDWLSWGLTHIQTIQS